MLFSRNEQNILVTYHIVLGAKSFYPMCWFTGFFNFKILLNWTVISILARSLVYF